MPPRRLVVCLDGTWNSTYDEAERDDGHKVLKPSNVLKLCRAVRPTSQDQRPQMTYYDIGVGSLAEFPGLSNKLLERADKILGGGWGAGFEGNVEDALDFIVMNYEDGDQIFLFGFSRGAATARGVTRFIDWAGGLPRKQDAYYMSRLFREFVVSHSERNVAQVIDEINKDRAVESPPRIPIALRSIPVEFIGVWDTVMALGSRFQSVGTSTSTVSRSFYVGSEPGRCVKHARQALAIDEARFDFRPEIWTGCSSSQTLRQRWFAGVHSNVGGGYVHDGLANLALRWILKEACAIGLDIDEDFIKPYRGFPMDRMYESDKPVYKVLDAIRFRLGRGKRALVERPDLANLSVDASVIERLNAEPGPRFPSLRERYRPENLIEYLARLPDLGQALAQMGLPEDQRRLPADVMSKISESRRKS